MKLTINGRTGRAQLIMVDMTGENVPLRKRKDHVDYCVRLLPRTAHRSTSFSVAGDEVYFGPDLEKALMHIRAWTGEENINVPARMRQRSQTTA